MNRSILFVCILVVSFSCVGFTAEPTVRSTALPRLAVPDGWSQTIAIASPPMTLEPSPATGLPSGQIVRPFEFRIIVRERLSEAAHTARVTKNDEIRRQLPNSKIVPPEYRKLQQEVLPEADFYDEYAAYEFENPSWLPASEEDRQVVLRLYEQLRANWTVYPSSRHNEKDYFARLLKGP